MADPRWNWLGPKDWSVAACGAAGMIVGGVLMLAIKSVVWLVQ